MLAKKLMGATAAKKKLYVDDVFSTYLYTGNGGTQTINNGIDLAGEGGLVWTKNRNNSFGSTGVLASTSHFIWDFTIDKYLRLNENSSSDPISNQFQPRNNGFFINTSHAAWNAAGGTQLQSSWTFRRAPKFFDIVTYTGDGTPNRQIAHALGAEPGFITTKSTNTTGNWNSYHRSATGDLVLNSTAAQTGSRAIIIAADSSTFTVSGAANTNGVQYVAYLWAHDPSEDGIVQCGSYVGNGSSGLEVNHGFEPQFVIIKPINDTSHWTIFDSLRGIAAGGNNKILLANMPQAEGDYGITPNIELTPRGFRVLHSGVSLNGSGKTYIYLAIRRPNKPPKSGTEVFAPVAYIGSTGTKVTTGFPVDWQLQKWRAGIADSSPSYSRLTGISTNETESGRRLQTHLNGAEAEYAPQCRFWDNSGFQIPFAYSDATTISWNFRRAPGFFDVVCDTGTGTAHAISHNLIVAPELVIRKSRSAATQWEVWHSALAANEKLVLNSNAAKVTDSTAWNSTAPGASSFTVGTGANVNANGATFVTYLFATLAGISKVGSYTGNGSSQTIDCGFTTGARFILIKRTDAAGDWYVWDSARGITSGNDPRLSLNTTAAEVTGLDTIDPDPTGFIVNQDASDVNVSGAEYIFLAIS